MKTLIQKAMEQEKAIQKKFQDDVKYLFFTNFDKSVIINFTSVEKDRVTFEVEGLKFEGVNKTSLYRIRIFLVCPLLNKNDRQVNNLVDVLEALRDWKMV